jgi:hypothetical protein
MVTKNNLRRRRRRRRRRRKEFSLKKKKIKKKMYQMQFEMSHLKNTVSKLVLIKHYCYHLN